MAYLQQTSEYLASARTYISMLFICCLLHLLRCGILEVFDHSYIQLGVLKFLTISKNTLCLFRQFIVIDTLDRDSGILE